MTLNEFNTAINNGKVLVDFNADWCRPCKVMNPILDELQSEGYNILKVNVDNSAEVSSLYKIRSIPHLWYLTMARWLNKLWELNLKKC